MNKKIIIPPFFLLTIAIASLAYSALVYHKDIEGTFTITNDHSLRIAWLNGSENVRFDLGEVLIGDRVELPSVKVTCEDNGGYVAWRYYGSDALRATCKEVDEGACVLYTSGHTIFYTFVITVLAKPIDAGTHNFTIAFEMYDELPTG